MTIKNGSEKYIKFVIYLVVIVLLNIAGASFYIRADLTQNRVYSISDVSRRVVSTLSEPLTIKVFFTRNLPAPYNHIEQYVRDLLNEYGLYANKHFHYTFYDVSPDEGDTTAGARRNQELANSYGIYPMQIQAFEEDEIKFQKAYMGLVLIHGDIIEQIPTIASSDGLEYKLTTAIRKLNNKVSALLNLSEKIQVKLFLSSSLNHVAPYMRLTQIPSLPVETEKIVNRLNEKNYDKLAFEHLDPSRDAALYDQVRAFGLLNLKWPELEEGKIPAGTGAIGIVLQYGDKTTTIPLMQVIKLPVIGTHYEMADLKDLERTINKKMETLIDINQDLGFLASHGALSSRNMPPSMAQQQKSEAVNTFSHLMSENYALKEVDLHKGIIPSDLDCLVIPGPVKTFSDYELFQIDQFLMQGKSLAVFLDSFQEVFAPAGMNLGRNQPPVYFPLKTGLEKLLAHYGVRLGASYILDENCYKQEVPKQYGGGERPLYFVPKIENEQINHSLRFMQNIKGLLSVKISPLELDHEKINKNGLTAHRLLTSSPRSWEMRDRIDLNPMTMRPPAADQQKSYPLAYLLEGEFDSYFADKPIPEKTIPEETSTEQEGAAPETASEKPEADAPTGAEGKSADLSKIKGEGTFRSKGSPGKIFIIASTEMIKDSLLGEQGRDPNDMFIMNVIDYLNDHEDTAVMRSKVQRFNPLRPTRPAIKTFIKAFNIAVVPILVVFFGIAVWFRRHIRKKKIRTMFQP